MNKLQLRNLIREQVRNVLRSRNPKTVKEAALTPIGKKLQQVHGEIYDYGDDGLDYVTGFMQDAKLDKVYDKWLEGDKLSPMEEKNLLKAMTDALDEMSNELEEVRAVTGVNEAATLTLPKGFYVWRESGMTPEEGGYGEFNYAVAYWMSEREGLRVKDVAGITARVFKMANQVAKAINGDRAEGMASLGGDDPKNIKMTMMYPDGNEKGIAFVAYVYSKMAPKQARKMIKGTGVQIQ